MQICIHRGSNQIGGSCLEIKSYGKRIIIDLGLPLDADPNDAGFLPDIHGFDGSDDSLLGILISHPHLDHFGLLSQISSKIPVYMGKDGRRIIEKASPFLSGNWPVQSGGQSFKSKKVFKIEPFIITPYLIDHSAYDAYSFLIEAEGKRVFYSGDIRMHGRKAKLTEKLISNPPNDIDVLLMEGTSLGRVDNKEVVHTEKDIENKLAEIFAETDGLVLMHTSSQNIDRLVSIYRACIKTGRTMIIDLYTAEILEATGNSKIPKSDSKQVALFIPQSQRVKILKNKWFDLLDHHSTNRISTDIISDVPAKFVCLFRPLHIHDLEKAGCLNKAVYIYSQWGGYWNLHEYSELKKWLTKHGIPRHSIHTSGHATTSDLKRFAEALKPARLVPMHTFNPEKYPELFDNVELHADGEYWEV